MIFSICTSRHLYIWNYWAPPLFHFDLIFTSNGYLLAMILVFMLEIDGIMLFSLSRNNYFDRLLLFSKRHYLLFILIWFSVLKPLWSLLGRFALRDFTISAWSSLY